jgi:hypothetical protein
MDDDIAGVDQYPVALRQTFDARASKACVLQLLDEVIGDGSYVPLRAPRSDYHLIADRGLSLQVYDRDFLSLGGIERVEHDLQEAVRMRAK